jgi:hypothetical protein
MLQRLLHVDSVTPSRRSNVDNKTIESLCRDFDGLDRVSRPLELEGPVSISTDETTLAATALDRYACGDETLPLEHYRRSKGGPFA